MTGNQGEHLKNKNLVEGWCLWQIVSLTVRTYAICRPSFYYIAAAADWIWSWLLTAEVPVSRGHKTVRVSRKTIKRRVFTAIITHWLFGLQVWPGQALILSYLRHARKLTTESLQQKMGGDPHTAIFVWLLSNGRYYVWTVERLSVVWLTITQYWLMSDWW